MTNLYAQNRRYSSVVNYEFRTKEGVSGDPVKGKKESLKRKTDESAGLL